MQTISFEVLPITEGAFDALVFDVPLLKIGEEDRAARRAYFSAMALLNGEGLDVADFVVNEWSDTTGSGRRVGPAGFVDIPGTCRTCSRSCGSMEAPNECC